MKQHSLTITRKERYISERVNYILGMGVRAALGGVLGYGAKKALEGIGYALDQFNNVVLPAAAQADQQVGKVIVEQGGKVGEAIIQVDKFQGDIWSKMLGRTPEQQKKWREEHGLEQPKYIDEPKTTVTVEVAPRAPMQPTTYQQEFSQYGDGLLTTGILLGGLWGAIRGFGNYRKAKQQKQILRTQQAVLKETQALNERVAALEKRFPQNGTSLVDKIEDEQP
ncbi:hypothetical protein J4208_04225 [Candidatus Woesearchaeota archaeon]|nr:hypothetical protein [Candidatus Woesearchaeota archaeon]